MIFYIFFRFTDRVNFMNPKYSNSTACRSLKLIFLCKLERKYHYSFLYASFVTFKAKIGQLYTAQLTFELDLNCDCFQL